MKKEKVMEKVRQWIEEEFGRRCAVMTYGCPVCEIWMAYDELFTNFEAEYSWPKEVNIMADDEYHKRGKKLRQTTLDEFVKK